MKATCHRIVGRIFIGSKMRRQGGPLSQSDDIDSCLMEDVQCSKVENKYPGRIDGNTRSPEIVGDLNRRTIWRFWVRLLGTLGKK